jgi:signal transduction histidine kinase
MTGLLNGLLELSRIGRIINPPRPVALQNLAAEVVELLNGPIEAKQARVHIATDLPVVAGDAQRLQEVLQNLVENALKFTRENQPPEIEIGTVAGTNPPTIFVRDNGQGIEARHLVTIFGLFNKLDNRTSGHGIGLALAQRIIEFHGGKIWAESAGAGQGATFYFSLPAASRA